MTNLSLTQKISITTSKKFLVKLKIQTIMKRIQIKTKFDNCILATQAITLCSITKINTSSLDAYARFSLNNSCFEIRPERQKEECALRINIETMFKELDELLPALEDFVFGVKYKDKHKMTIEAQEKTEVKRLNTATVRLHTITPQTPRSFINDPYIKCEDANLLTDWDVEVPYADGIEDEAIIGTAIIALRQELGVNDLQVDDSLITDRISGETKTTFIRYTIE